MGETMNNQLRKAETMNYETPLGTFDIWEEAANACERCDFDPVLCIQIRESN
jgi:hypothetical protein